MKNLLKKSSKHLSSLISHLSISKGFTLIELLVVIAVIGVLAAIVLLAVNPGEQLARARDTSRISAVTQVGRALQAYYTAQSTPTYPTAPSTTWMTTMVTSQDLKTAPTNPTYAAGAGTHGCNGYVTLAQNEICYNTAVISSNTEALVFVRLEATLNSSKCAVPATEKAWAVFSTVDARAGIVCTTNAATDPTVIAQLFR